MRDSPAKTNKTINKTATEKGGGDGAGDESKHNPQCSTQTHHLVIKRTPILIRKPLLLIIQIREIQHNRPTLKHPQIAILECRNSPVGINLQIPILFLFVGHDIDGLDVIFEAEFFEHDDGFEAVGGTGGVEGEGVEGGGGHFVGSARVVGGRAGVELLMLLLKQGIGAE